VSAQGRCTLGAEIPAVGHRSLREPIVTEFENLAYALDPVAYAKAGTGFDLDDWQVELLRAATADAAFKGLCLISRQLGKSRAVSVVAAWQALFRPKSLTVVASGSQGQSQELGRQIFQTVRAVDPDEVKAENLSRIELRNGSRVICLPQSETVRGLSNAELVIVDEAQLVEREMFAALEPMQAIVKKPKLIILGTATSRVTKFYEYYKSGDFKVFERRADQCDRISKEFLADKKKSLGELLYGAEFENRWIADATQIVSDELLEAAICDYVPMQCKGERK
jgi:hypothetical protein